MANLEKFKGIFPALLACYDDAGNVSAERTKNLVEYCYQKGASGLYITGSSGEFVYQSVEERKTIMKAVAEAAGGRMTIIAHVAANSTADSVELAAYAKECKLDAVSSVPPYYFTLPVEGVMAYWEAIINAAQLPFILYNVPSTTGVTISEDIFRTMLKNPMVIGIKNTSLPVMDILKFKDCGGDDCVVFNGPDEQFVAGRLMGADGGIGSTYIAMLDLYIKADQLVTQGDYAAAGEIQKFITRTIFDIIGLEGHLMSVLKAILRRQGIEVGEARLPLMPVTQADGARLDTITENIRKATKRFCS